MRRPALPTLLIPLVLVACRAAAGPAPDPGAGSDADPARARLETELEASRAALDAEPSSEEALIWYGRRLAYLGRHEEAIEVYTRGLELHPRSHRLLRHRGHRYITTRRFDLALADLERARERVETFLLENGGRDPVEPDGLPNARGVPLGTDRGNILYHLGLVQYLLGRFDDAARTFAARVETHRYPDNVASTAYWRYLALRRLERDAQARAALDGVRADADIIENHAYQDLCLLFLGERTFDELDAESDGGATPSGAALAYGLAAYLLVEGRTEEARRRWRRIVDDAASPDAFGVIAAEAELTRLRSGG